MPELSSVVILNPAPGGHRRLSYAHARRYVRQGRAEWVKGSVAIRFRESDHRHQSASRSLRQQTAPGYDSRGMLTIDEIPRLPTAGDAVRLIAGHRCLV